MRHFACSYQALGQLALNIINIYVFFSVDFPHLTVEVRDMLRDGPRGGGGGGLEYKRGGDARREF